MSSGTYNEVFFVQNKDITITNVKYCDSITNTCSMDLHINGIIEEIEVCIDVYPFLHDKKEFFAVCINFLYNYPAISSEVLQKISLLAERFRMSCIYEVHRILSVGHLPYSLISEEDLIKSYIKKVIHT